MVFSYRITLKNGNTKEVLNISKYEMFHSLENRENDVKSTQILFKLIFNDLDLIKEFRTFGFNLIVKDVYNKCLVVECNTYKNLKNLLDMVRVIFRFDFISKLDLEEKNEFYKYVLGLENFSSSFELNKLMFEDHLTHNEKFKEIFNYFKLNE